MTLQTRHVAWLLVWFISPAICLGQSAPKPVAKLFEKHCLDCHSKQAAEGDVVLSVSKIDWKTTGQLIKWEHVHTMLSKGIMPPPDAEQPTEDQRKLMLSWVDQQLMTHSPIGGTLLRRLNRREYANTIDDLFSLNGFELPAEFPPDNEARGFDNQADALVMARPHMEALAVAATSVADELFPPDPPPVASRELNFKPNDMTITYSSAYVVDQAMRLASGDDNFRRHCTWPSRFEAPAAGVYRIKLKLSTLNAPEETPILMAEALSAAEIQRVPGKATRRVLKEIKVDSGQVQVEYEFEAELQRTETVAFRYSNADFNYEDKAGYRDFLRKMFAAEPKLAAAWHKIGQPARGGNGWVRVKQAMADPNLDASDYTAGSKKIEAVVNSLAGNSVKSGETLVHKFFEEGPNIGIHQLTITGPIRTAPDLQLAAKRQIARKLIGDAYDNPEPRLLKSFFNSFLTDAFRRPAKSDEVNRYVDLVLSEVKAGRTAKSGMHLAIRTALLSPAFLYREIGSGPLNDFELANRLSYFLTSHSPDDSLRKIATAGRLNRTAILEKETKRLLGRKFKSKRSFIGDFTTGWLNTENVDRLMPDARLIRRFTAKHRSAMKAEVERTFTHILDNNLPVTDFISPDFMFTDATLGWDIYGLEKFKPLKGRKNKKANAAKTKKGMQLVEIPRDGKLGGLLCMSAVMMSTANGVDTQPVLRGVWVLDNVFGNPPPEPPNAVPALTPDTTGAATPKQRLAAHMTDQNCAVCHQEIDPIGFALENFDPIGRWRSHYPIFKDEDGKSKTEDGSVVDSTGRLPDGTEIHDVTDLKKWLTGHPEVFATCLSEKLMTYATGRRLNYRERKVIAEIVEQQKSNDLRFKNLLLALVNSEIFRNK